VKSDNGVNPDLNMEQHAYSSFNPVRNIAAQSLMCITQFNMLSEDSERNDSALIRVKAVAWFFLLPVYPG